MKNYAHGTVAIMLKISEVCGVTIGSVKNTPLTMFENRSRIQQAFHVGVAWYTPSGKTIAIIDEIEDYFSLDELPNDRIIAKRLRLTARYGPKSYQS